MTQQSATSSWWPDLLTTWNRPLRVAEPGHYADYLPEGDRYLTCHKWTHYRGPTLAFSKYGLNIIHGQPGSGKSATCQALLSDLCLPGKDPGLRASVLTATNLTWTTWVSRMAEQEQAGRPADIQILNSINIWTDAGLSDLMDRLIKWKPDIIVLDCLNDVLPPGQPANQAQAWTAIFQNLNIVSRQVEQQTGNHVVQVGVVQETEQALLKADSYTVWSQSNLTLRVIPISDTDGSVYCVLYPTAGGKNQDNVPIRPVAIHQKTNIFRTELIAKKVVYYQYSGPAPINNLDIPGQGHQQT